MHTALSTEDLLATARAIRPDFSKKTLDSWVASGFLAKPTRGRGKRFYFPPGQDDILCLQARARRADGKKVLDFQRAEIVMFAFLSYGEQAVTMPQLSKVWDTWVRARLPRKCQGHKPLTSVLEEAGIGNYDLVHKTANNMARTLALAPEDRRAVSLALQHVIFDGTERRGDSLEQALKRAWAGAGDRLQEESIRGIREVLTFKAAALAHADAITDDYWRWVGPFWRFTLHSPLPVTLLSAGSPTIDNLVSHAGQYLLTLFGMALLVPAEQWQVPAELRPVGLYRTMTIK